MDVFLYAFVDDFYGDITFELIEKFFCFFPVVIFAGVRSAYYHDDKIIVQFIHLLVAYGWLEQVTVFIEASA